MVELTFDERRFELVLAEEEQMVADVDWTRSDRIRLTVRGRLIMLVAVLALFSALSVLVAGAAAGRGSTATSEGSVLVYDGDTLWSIAQRVAPGRDPRAEVDDLIRRNRLTGAVIVPGQLLRTG